MRRNLLVLAVLGVGFVLLLQPGCEEANKPDRKPEKVVQQPGKDTTVKTPPSAGGRGPQIKFDKLVHNFGEIGPATDNFCEFKFTNVGDARLEIVDVNADCGCTLVTLDKEACAPGESATLKLKYHAALRGMVNRHVVVASNAKADPEVTLTLKARIVPKIVYEPKRLNVLLKKQDESLPEITLTSVDGKAFSITSITSTANAMDAAFDPSAKSKRFVLQFRIDKTKLRRVTDGVIEIGTTHPECKSIAVPFTALPGYKINPPVIIVFNAVAGKVITRPNVSILNNYQEDFEIASVKSKEGTIKVAKRDKIGSGYNLTLEITPPDLGGKSSFTDELSVQIKGAELLKITLQGFYSKKTPK